MHGTHLNTIEAETTAFLIHHGASEEVPAHYLHRGATYGKTGFHRGKTKVPNLLYCTLKVDGLRKDPIGSRHL